MKVILTIRTLKKLVNIRCLGSKVKPFLHFIYTVKAELYINLNVDKLHAFKMLPVIDITRLYYQFYNTPSLVL